MVQILQNSSQVEKCCDHELGFLKKRGTSNKIVDIVYLFVLWFLFIYLVKNLLCMCKYKRNVIVDHKLGIITQWNSVQTQRDWWRATSLVSVCISYDL